MARLKTPLSIALVAVIVLGGGYFGWRHYGAAEARQTKAGAAPPAAVPVQIATAERRDFPVYLSGLGTVQGFNTVVVRTRVDGQIDKISFKEGQFVKQGELLAQIDPRPFQAALDQAKAKKAQDEANLANAHLDLQRFTKLGEFATKQQTDTQRSTVTQLTAQIAADDAAIANAQTQLDYTAVKAPIAGVTGFRQVDQGNIVNAATQTGIVTIAQIEPIAVVFTVPEEQLTEINRAQAKQPLTVTALSADGRTKLSDGKLAVVNNQVDSTSGTVRLKAVFDNKDHVLWPGLSVSTRLLVATLKDTVVVPDDAVKRGVNGLYAFVVDADNKAEVRDLKVGQSNDGHTVVEQGIKAGDRVVVAGQYRVQQGSPLAISVASSEAGPAQLAAEAQ
ncbi:MULTISPECIES: efflux RND transporter periplasmic adaptor subunit [Rhodopseudomonas]|uniref:RND transporter n=1 Tax=Rhodopseudomonas palustris TaxID=1076 RepID=A0A0D7F4W2_RHOPL|nr:MULTISPECIES: efflux RND transporter periplasmic adaptor subunit [Rhodopseudomonas]KIZ48174.1 RND transporter [Rhodopseudomonas palustris]MDF3809148.1 efflux RND transporter periplasmic adaptor subunit [Rhodopseudomonas sp. BAL398]WOK16107.1 efflux RND transporter periplasmic adaptor subunit [Rhodopseudomonas sp. BAL398]